MPHISLSLFGTLQVMIDGVPVTAFESDKVRALLVYLVVEGDQPHRRSALAGLLWPDRPERAALLNLNQALANLRRTLGERDAAVPLLLVSREAIQLNRDADYTLDLATFTALIDACEHHAHRNPHTCVVCAGRLTEAVALYRGAFLETFAPRDSQIFQEWALVVRERSHRLMLTALNWLVQYHEHRQAYATALPMAHRQLELDPWNEEAHRQAMRLLWADGQRSAALAQYERCRQVLEDELGLEPEEETEALYAQIVAGEFSSHASNERTKQAAAPTSHTSVALAPALDGLPQPPTPFLGRTQELAQLADYLCNPSCHLVTIVGLGGSGKTRLALATVDEQRQAFADGVCVVSLATITNVALLLPTIAAALDMAPSGAPDLETQIVTHLREKELLLVLDNLEQIQGAAPVIGSLLARVPRLTILATSRERLQLRGEWVLDLGGLDLPASAAPAAIETSSATALFLQAARRARGNFTPRGDEWPIIARMCRALAGHPLAIELAAAWAHVLSCAEIEAELTNSLELLHSDIHDLPERHRALRVVLDASWQLLGDAEQRTLRQLSMFRGGFTREAAATVAGAKLPLLAALLNRSWLHRAADDRYTLHEFIRQYADEQLQRAGETDSTGARHIAFFLVLVEQAEPHLKGADAALWMEQLALEHDNVRAALGLALRQAMIEQAARICAVLRWFWYQRGYIGEGRAWLEQVLAADTNATQLSPQLRARLFQATGIFADEQGDYSRSAECYEHALTLYRQIDDVRGIQTTLNSRGLLAWAQGDYTFAQDCYTESVRLARQLGNTWGIANGLNSLGTTVQALNDCARALAAYEEALPIARYTGYEPLITMILDNIGEVLLAQGDTTHAHTAYAEALARQQAQNDTRGAALSLQGLGMVALTQGDLDLAAHHMMNGLAGEWHTGSQRELASYLDNIAALLVAQNRATDAARLCGATDALRARIGTPLTPFEQRRHAPTIAAVRDRLDHVTFSHAWALGQATPLEQLIADLLQTHAAAS